jgi:isoquinoline 1-oxidoreductase beta subunit
MNKHVTPKLTRRGFVIGTAAAGAGLAIGLDIPFGGPTVVRAADGSPEVNVWVVIRPDDTTVIRIARSEMGQGTLTGLAQLVAEELECDWSKVVTEYPTPGQSVARHRACDAGAGRRERMEGAGLGMHGFQQRHYPHAVGQDHDLRQGG